MSEEIDVSKLRIVCMECPAVARIHFAEYTWSSRSVEIWCECHGEHMFGWVSDTEIERSGPERISMQAISRCSAECMEERRNDLEAELLAMGKRLEVYERFLALGGPKTERSYDT